MKEGYPIMPDGPGATPEIPVSVPSDETMPGPIVGSVSSPTSYEEGLPPDASLTRQQEENVATEQDIMSQLYQQAPGSQERAPSHAVADATPPHGQVEDDSSQATYVPHDQDHGNELMFKSPLKDSTIRGVKWVGGLPKRGWNGTIDHLKHPSKLVPKVTKGIGGLLIILGVGALWFSNEVSNAVSGGKGGGSGH